MYSLLGAIVTSSLIYVCEDEIEIAERGMWGNVLHPFLMRVSVRSADTDTEYVSVSVDKPFLSTGRDRTSSDISH